MDKQNITYIALLRGINVGGNNIIKMIDLKACFESMGFTDVVTYIQSGNVAFKTSDHNQDRVTDKIEAELARKFDRKLPVVVVSHTQLKKVVDSAPPGFGIDSTTYRYDVMFLKKPYTPSEAIRDIKTKEGVDEVYAGQDVLYFSRLIEKAAHSYLSRIITLPIYKYITIRNWNTTTKLFALSKK